MNKNAKLTAIINDHAGKNARGWKMGTNASWSGLRWIFHNDGA